MKHLLFATVAVLTAFTLLVGCAAQPAAPAPTAAPAVPAQAARAIVLGDIDSQPTDQIRKWQLLADYLAANLGDYGIGSGAVKVAPDMETMGKWLTNGDVDLTFESIYPAMIEITRYGSQPILRQWKGGDAEYSSIIFTRADSTLKTLDDLKGRTIAFEQPTSTTAYFLPVAAIAATGLKPVEQAGPGKPAQPDIVGYVFSGADDNSIQWVISGKVDAGATSNQDYRDIPQDSRDQLTVLYETNMVPRQVVMARAGMEPELLERIRVALMALDETEEGRAILKEFEETAKFDELPAEAEAELARIEKLYQQLQLGQ